MTAHSVASAHTYYSMFEGRPQSNPHERDRLLLGVLTASGGVEEAEFLEDEAVVAAGGDFLHDLVSPVAGEVARVAEPRGAAVGADELGRNGHGIACWPEPSADGRPTQVCAGLW